MCVGVCMCVHVHVCVCVSTYLIPAFKTSQKPYRISYEESELIPRVPNALCQLPGFQLGFQPPLFPCGLEQSGDEKFFCFFDSTRPSSVPQFRQQEEHDAGSTEESEYQDWPNSGTLGETVLKAHQQDCLLEEMEDVGQP